MNQIIPARPGRKAFAVRRLALLASAAGLAIAVVAGTSSFSTTTLPSAIATAHAETMQRSTGFADIRRRHRIVPTQRISPWKAGTSSPSAGSHSAWA
jgi:hypothetical protein